MSALLSKAFARIVDDAFVSDAFEFDGRCGDYEYYLEQELDISSVVFERDGYAIQCDGDEDMQDVVLIHDGKAVGFYADLMIWIDPEHRGKGLSVDMVTAFADHYGAGAYRDLEKRLSPLGFSVAGWRAHEKAAEIAREFKTSRNPPRP